MNLYCVKISSIMDDSCGCIIVQSNDESMAVDLARHHVRVTHPNVFRPHSFAAYEVTLLEVKGSGMRIVDKLIYID